MDKVRVVLTLEPLAEHSTNKFGRRPDCWPCRHVPIGAIMMQCIGALITNVQVGPSSNHLHDKTLKFELAKFVSDVVFELII